MRYGLSTVQLINNTPNPSAYGSLRLVTVLLTQEGPQLKIECQENSTF